MAMALERLRESSQMDSTRCSSQLGIEKNEREREVLIVSQGPGFWM